MSEPVVNQTNIIDIAQFAAIELRIGTILECVEVEKSERLLRMQVDFGVLGNRQILSGVKKYFKPEDLIGKQATFVVNFAPRAMMGFASHGMMLTAQDEHGFSILTPSQSMQPGSAIK
jgi:methionyl-tRNA synthetase